MLLATELIVCPRCGANPTAAPDVYGQYVCGYCGARFRTQQPVAPVARPVHVPPPARPAAAPPKKTNVAVVVGAAAGFVVLGGAAAGAIAWQSAGVEKGAAALAAPQSTPGNNGALAVSAATAEPEVPATASFQLESRAAGYKKSFYALGFVTNTSPFTIDKPKITAVLLDKAGKELATRDGYGECDSLAAHATAPVKVLVNEPPAFDELRFEVVAKKADYVPEPATDLRLEVLEKPHPTFGTSWEVTGKVFNEGKEQARFVKIDVLAFDAQNKLIGLDFTYVDGEALAAGASGRFRALPLYDSAPHHFKLEVSGRHAN